VIEPCLQSEVFMEHLRREAKTMSREQLLVVIDSLSKLYCTTKAGANWLAKEASKGAAARMVLGEHLQDP
jgi:hypothetical protein